MVATAWMRWISAFWRPGWLPVFRASASIFRTSSTLGSSCGSGVDASMVPSAWIFMPMRRHFMRMASGVFLNFAAISVRGTLFSMRVLSSFSSCALQCLPRVIFSASFLVAAGFLLLVVWWCVWVFLFKLPL